MSEPTGRLADLDRIFQTCRKPGWDGYHAEPVTQESIALAVGLDAFIPEEAVVGPHPDGGVEYEWDNAVGDNCLVTVWAQAKTPAADSNAENGA